MLRQQQQQPAATAVPPVVSEAKGVRLRRSHGSCSASSRRERPLWVGVKQVSSCVESNDRDTGFAACSPCAWLCRVLLFVLLSLSRFNTYTIPFRHSLLLFIASAVKTLLLLLPLLFSHKIWAFFERPVVPKISASSSSPLLAPPPHSYACSGQRYTHVDQWKP